MSRFALRVAACGSIIVACAIYLCVSGVIAARDNAWAAEQEAGRNLAHALASDIANITDSLSLSLRGVQDNIRAPGVAEAPPHIRHMVLFDTAATSSQFGSLLVVSPDGEVLLGTRDPASQRPRRPSIAGTPGMTALLRELADASRDAVVVTHPFTARSTGQPAFALMRKLEDAEGRYIGAVIGSIRLDILGSRFEALTRGQSITISLLRGDGVMLARAPHVDGVIGQAVGDSPSFRRVLEAPFGQFVGASPIDGGERLVSHSVAGGAGLRVLVSVPVAEIEARWMGAAFLGAGATALLFAVLGILGACLVLELRRRTRAEVAAHRIGTMFRLVADNGPDVVSVIGADGRRSYVSANVRGVLGYGPDELVGRKATSLAIAEDAPALSDALARLQIGITDKEVVRYRSQHAGGRQVWLETALRKVDGVHADGGSGIVAMMRDVTDQAMREAALAKAAERDALPGVMNRRAFDGALEAQAGLSRSHGEPLSVIFIDVDYFKLFNDSQGHPAGDRCLREIGAALLAQATGGRDMVARYGGEEFVLLLPDTTEERAAAIAERLRDAIEGLRLPHPARVDGVGVVTVSVGAATQSNCASGAALIDAADRALYEAKRAGRNRVQQALKLAA